MTNLTTRKRELNKGTAGFFIGIVVLLFSSVLAIIFVHKQFAGYDLSPIIDLSWRLANHQIPGVDFINTLPPLFIIFIKFVSWGNLHWVDLTLINIIAVSGAFLFLYFVSDHQEESMWWGLFIALILAIPLVYTNHIWPSTLAQLSGIIFFYCVYVAINTNHLRPKILLSLLAASGILALSKQNVALPMMLAVVVFLFFLKRRDRFILITFILIGAVSGVVLSMLYLGYSFDHFLYTYSAVLGRAKISGVAFHIFRLWSHHLLVFLMLSLVCLFIYSLFEKNSRISRVNKVYFILIFAVSLIPITTDWDCKFNNVSLPLFIFTTGIFASVKAPVDNLTSKPSRHDPAPRIFIAFAVLFTIYTLSVLCGYLRERTINSMLFFGFGENVNKGYFSGLRTSDRFTGILNEMLLAKAEFSHQKIFFGICMELGYLYTQSPSPSRMPLTWHPGTTYGLFDEKKIIDTFIQAKFDVLIFFKDIKTFTPYERLMFDPKILMPREILDFIDGNYSIYDKYQYIDLYRRIKPSSSLFFFKKGNAYANLSQHKLAIEYYNKTILLNPDYTEAYYKKGLSYFELGQYHTAIRVYSEIVRKIPDYFLAYFNRGIAYTKLGQYSLAIKDYTKVISLKPNYTQAYNNRGAAFLTQGNTIIGCLDAQKACDLGECRLLKLAESNKACH